MIPKNSHFFTSSPCHTDRLQYSFYSFEPILNFKARSARGGRKLYVVVSFFNTLDNLTRLYDKVVYQSSRFVYRGQSINSDMRISSIISLCTRRLGIIITIITSLLSKNKYTLSTSMSRYMAGYCESRVYQQHCTILYMYTSHLYKSPLARTHHYIYVYWGCDTRICIYMYERKQHSTRFSNYPVGWYTQLLL